MNDNTQLYGKDHVILSSTDSVVLGNDHRLSQGIELGFWNSGKNGVHRSLVFSDDSYVGFTQSSQISG